MSEGAMGSAVTAGGTQVCWSNFDFKPMLPPGDMESKRADRGDKGSIERPGRDGGFDVML
jgi:hypothetical protein